MTNTLTATIDVDATPEHVWSIVSDLSRMPEWSPQCRRMQVFGPVREGARTFNINRKGLLVWPTTAKVVRFEAGKSVAFRINENHTVWSYELTPNGEGTTITERREAPQGTTKLSSTLVDKVLGGAEPFEEDLVSGMNAGLRRIKVAAESI